MKGELCSPRQPAWPLGKPRPCLLLSRRVRSSGQQLLQMKSNALKSQNLICSALHTLTTHINFYLLLLVDFRDLPHLNKKAEHQFPTPLCYPKYGLLSRDIQCEGWHKSCALGSHWVRQGRCLTYILVPEAWREGERLCSSHTLQRSSNSDQIKRAADLLSEPIEHSETQSMTSSLRYTSQTTLGSVRVGRQEDL